MNTCIHYWLIDLDNTGICKYCGSQKKFPSFLEIEIPVMQHSAIKTSQLHSDTGYNLSAFPRTRANESFKSFGIYI